MLYVQRGYSSKVMQAVPGTLKDYLTRYNIPTFTVSTDNVKDLKRKLDYAYSGMLTDNRRSNDTIKSRDILALDLDNINPSINTPDKLLNGLTELLGALEFILYPTIKNGLEGYGLRYRLLIEIPPLLPGTYILVAKGFIYGLIDKQILTSNWDESTTRPAQLFSLPVRNQFTQGEVITHHQGAKLTADAIKESLPSFKALISKYEDETDFNHPPTNYVKRNADPTKGAYWLSEITQGIGEGRRNNTMYNFAWYWLVCGMADLGALPGLYDFLMTINQAYFTPPLSDAEINHIFKSAIKGYERVKERG